MLNTSSKLYNPISFFYVDNRNLLDADPANFTVDAFGPVADGPGLSTYSKYRTTSKIHTSEKARVFAICKGRVLIQPSDSPDKINLILKPDTSIYSPIKIKYFIYRNIDKGDYVIDLLLAPKNSSDPHQPQLLKKIWDQYTKLVLDIVDTGNNPVPDLLAKFIGFDPENQTDNSSLDSYFFNSTDVSPTPFYQLPICEPGDHIGNFSDWIGLDIVLDFGDFKLGKQSDLFLFDLAFARRSENVFDLNTPALTTSIHKKRYKECIHQFLDAAAFWGSHMECGLIKLNDNETQINDSIIIYDEILKKFQTANSLYVYIQDSNGRSYGYETPRQISGFIAGTNDISLEDYYTHEWPVLIKKNIPPVSVSDNVITLQINLQYTVDNKISTASVNYDYHRFIYLDVVSPNNDTSIFPSQQVVQASTQALNINNPFKLNFQTDGVKFYASFLIIHGRLTIDFPLASYFDELWPADFGPIFSIPSGIPNSAVSAVYDKSRLVDLTAILGFGAVIKNSMVIDNCGYNGTTTNVQRRLFIAAIKRNSGHKAEFDNVNVDSVSAGVINQITNSESYNNFLYNQSGFSIYGGTLTDYTDSGNPFLIKSLSLIHNDDFDKKNSFLHLGLSEDEFQSLFQSLPSNGIENIYFELREVLDSNNVSVSVNNDYKKFQLGLKFEDASNVIIHTLDANPISNPLFIYTVDGFYFFSKIYSDTQPFLADASDAYVFFRPKIFETYIKAGQTIVINPYAGEFGFDWIRDGDNGERKYSEIIDSGYEIPKRGDLTNTKFESKQEAFKEFKNEYKLFPTTIADAQYYAPYLNLFSEKYSLATNPITIGNAVPAFPPYTAELRVLIQIPETLNKLEFDYNPLLFTISPSILPDKNVSLDNQTPPKVTRMESLAKTIQITCLQDFSYPQQIRVLAYPSGKTDKKDAKLAGLITVNSNDIFSRRELNYLLVKVKTNISGTEHTGNFQNDFLNLSIALHQMLIHPNYKIITLDLRQKTEFQTGGGAYINSADQINAYATGIYQFLEDSVGPLSKDDFAAFFFEEDTTDPNGLPLEGKARAQGGKSVLLFNRSNTTVLAHETLHGLGLGHSFENPSVPITQEQRFTFAYGNVPAATDNYMSYQYQNRQTLWNWQRKIISFVRDNPIT